MEHENTKASQAAFDAEVRATVESMRTRPVENVSVPTDVVLDAAVEATLNAEATSFAIQDASASATEPQHGDYTPHYHPKAPFRLKFSFDSTGRNYSDVTVLDPVFAWNDGTAVSMKTAETGEPLSPTGTVYLNVTVSPAGEYRSSSVGMTEPTESGVISVPLYELDASDGVVKDYRHAMIVLGPGGNRAPGPFEIDRDSSADGQFNFLYCYYQVGGETRLCAESSIQCSEGFICLEIPASSAEDEARLEVYDTFEELVERQMNLNYTIVPLYYVEEGEVVCDMRRMPTTGMLENVNVEYAPGYEA